MAKAKDFLECLCEEYNYRFFTGVPCEGLEPIYNAMSSDFMHYIPAVNEQVAVSLANGATIAGEKSIVLMSAYDLRKVDFSFNEDYTIPIVVVVFGDREDLNATYNEAYDFGASPFCELNGDSIEEKINHFFECTGWEEKILLLGEGDIL